MAASAAARETTLLDAAREFLRYPSPWIILANVAVFALLKSLVGGDRWDVVIAAAVAALWPLQEWIAHKYILHLKPFRLFRWTIDPSFAWTHREHHQRPWHLPRVFLPVRVLAGASLGNVLVWWAVMPRRSWALTGMLAYACMALLYEWTHYLTHTKYRPRSRFYAELCLAHRRHHFKNEHFWFSFTLPHVDRLLGTAPDHRQVATSATVRTLGVEPPDVSSAAAGPRRRR